MAVNVAQAGKRALLSTREDRQGTLKALEEAEARAEERERTAELRRQADEAWRREDYSAVRRIYAGLDASLTPVERKRMDMAARHG